MEFIDVEAVRARQADRDCTLARNCRNLRIAIEMGAELERSLDTVAAEITMKDWTPLQLKNSSNGALRYACYIPIK